MIDKDRQYEALGQLAALCLEARGEVNLRDSPAAYSVLDDMMRHAYLEGRRDEHSRLAPKINEIADGLRCKARNNEYINRNSVFAFAEQLFEAVRP